MTLAINRPEYIIPGLMLVIEKTEDPYEVLDRSCSFCNIPRPITKFDTTDKKSM